MSNYYGYDYSAPNDYLAHYGVPGMRWGHRKAPDRGSGGNGQGAPRKRHLGLKIAGGVAAGAAAAGLGYLGYKHRKGIGNMAKEYGSALSNAYWRKKQNLGSNRDIAKSLTKRVGATNKKVADVARRRAKSARSSLKGEYNWAKAAGRNFKENYRESYNRRKQNASFRRAMKSDAYKQRAGEMRDAVRLGADAVRSAAKNRLKRKRR